MTDEKYGPASLAATALSDSVPGMPTSATRPGAPAPATTHGLPRSGVGPAAAEVPPSEQPSSSGPIGRVINGRYKIKRLLGEGGMGGVYEGEHLEIGKRVAIKLVHALHARDPHIAARIKQEARSTGAIESENIVQVFDAGEDVDLGIFLVMEMLKGEDLGSLLARKGRISPMAAATMVIQAAQGLSRAHAAGIVHRDLKPANIFLSTRDDGTSLVKLVDFGIAKLVRDANRAQEAPGLTRVGMVIGTPQYMSPEQAQGLPTVDHKTDIYSLGAVLFEAIVGTSPYREMPTYEQTILQIMTRPAPLISSVVPDVSPALDRLCAEMMAHEPSARPSDMAVVRERLLAIFPEIEGGRLPMRSLTNEAGYDQTLSADASGQVRALAEAALARAGLSGVGLAVSRPVPVQEQPEAPSADDDVSSVAGVPAPRRGMLIDSEGENAGVLSARLRIGVVAVLALVTGVGLVALVKAHGSAPPPAAASTYGIVQSTTVAVATTPTPPVPTPVTASPVAPPVVVQVPPLATAPAAAGAAEAAGVEASPAAATAGKAGRAHGGKPSKAAPPSPPATAPATATPTDKAPPPSARPVGGTSESTEF